MLRFPRILLAGAVELVVIACSLDVNGFKDKLESSGKADVETLVGRDVEESLAV